MSDVEEVVVLVDATDRETGLAPKLQAHLDGLLHRAISVIILNDRGEMLLQQREAGKYHSGGLWTNACCSHPRPGEEVAKAAARRLREEMGFEAKLVPMFSTVYRAELGALTEHEFVHVFGGRHVGPVNPDPAEVGAYEWRALPGLFADIEARPEFYTAWFRKYLRDHRAEVEALSARL